MALLSILKVAYRAGCQPFLKYFLVKNLQKQPLWFICKLYFIYWQLNLLVSWKKRQVFCFACYKFRFFLTLPCSINTGALIFHSIKFINQVPNWMLAGAKRKIRHCISRLNTVFCFLKPDKIFIAIGCKLAFKIDWSKLLAKTLFTFRRWKVYKMAQWLQIGVSTKKNSMKNKECVLEDR